MGQYPGLTFRSPRIAILIPCYNEGQTIFTVVSDFAAEFPNAAICVYDNNSNDDTKARAAAAGATVRSKVLQGKGNVIRQMFADIEAAMRNADEIPDILRLMRNSSKYRRAYE